MTPSRTARRVQRARSTTRSLLFSSSFNEHLPHGERREAEKTRRTERCPATASSSPRGALSGIARAAFLFPPATSPLPRPPAWRQQECMNEKNKKTEREQETIETETRHPHGQPGGRGRATCERVRFPGWPWTKGKGWCPPTGAASGPLPGRLPPAGSPAGGGPWRGARQRHATPGAERGHKQKTSAAAAAADRQSDQCCSARRGDLWCFLSPSHCDALSFTISGCSLGALGVHALILSRLMLALSDTHFALPLLYPFPFPLPFPFPFPLPLHAFSSPSPSPSQSCFLCACACMAISACASSPASPAQARERGPAG